MKVYKIHYKILNTYNKGLRDHVFIIKASSYEEAMDCFNSFTSSNLHSGDRLFGTPGVTEIPEEITKIYSSYI